MKRKLADNPIPDPGVQLEIDILKLVSSKRCAGFTFKLRKIVNTVHVKQTALKSQQPI
ncbi:hypothetical protein D3C85_1453600 [compost metagenome]